MTSVNDRIKLGEKIRDRVFEGNNYSQLGYIMEGIDALFTLINPDATPEEIAAALAKKDELLILRAKIQAILTSEE